MAFLRIRNSGTATLSQLRVRFPDTTVAFGDVSPGLTTDYRSVIGGVYAYAGFVFAVNGSDVKQIVDDWVGEVPLSGRQFTYTLELTDVNSPTIVIRDVTRDR